MQIEFKDYLTELKENHNKLLGIIQANCETSFFKELSEKLAEIHVDIRDTFGEYLWKCIYPISYKTISDEKSCGNYNTKSGQYAVGKWFGNIRHTNISYSNKNDWGFLSEGHIKLVPPKKQKIVKDFYNFRKRVEEFKESTKYPINISSHVQETNKIQTDNYEYYLTIKKQNSIIFTCIELNMLLHPLEIEFAIHGSDGSKETYKIRSTRMNTDIITSSSLTRVQEKSLANGSRICFDSPEIFLTPEIKSAMLGFIDKAKGLQDQWVELKTKYAYMLLNKGNI
jgi:hypothetical protein